MVHVAHRLAYCIHPNVIHVCRRLARQDLCFMLAARNIKLVFTSKLWLDALDRREELLVSIVWLSSTQPLTGNQHGLHLCSSVIDLITRMFENTTISCTQFISHRCYFSVCWVWRRLPASYDCYWNFAFGFTLLIDCIILF